MMNINTPHDFTQYPTNYIKRGHTIDEPFFNPSLQTLSISTATVVTTNAHIKVPFIFEQETLQSCVSNAISLCIAIINNNSFTPSRLFIYYYGRILGNYDILKDTGISVYDGCMSVQQYTPCSETNWPYLKNKLTVKPPPGLKPIPLTNFTFLAIQPEIEHFKQCIVIKTPIIFAITLFSSFYNASNTGIVVMPDIANETAVGSHCILMVGFDDNTQTVTCANSWGTKFGNKGLFQIPYAYLLNSDIAFDFYMIRFTTINTPTTNKCCGIS